MNCWPLYEFLRNASCFWSVTIWDCHNKERLLWSVQISVTTRKIIKKKTKASTRNSVVSEICYFNASQITETVKRSYQTKNKTKQNKKQKQMAFTSKFTVAVSVENVCFTFSVVQPLKLTSKRRRATIRWRPWRWPYHAACGSYKTEPHSLPAFLSAYVNTYVYYRSQQYFQYN